MKHGLIDPKGMMHELDRFRIEGLCKEMLKTAISNSEEYKKAYEEKYQGKITYFSEAIEFCIHELGWKLYDPFCIGKDDVLFSNGTRAYITSLARIQEQDFNPKSITRTDIGFAILTDETVGYDKSLENIDTYDDGIVNEKGYVSSKMVNENLDSLAKVILMHELSRNEELYNHYLKNRGLYSSQLEYLTSLPNCIAVDKLDNGQFALSFVSENDGRVQDFINSLVMKERLIDQDPMIMEEARAPMIK